MCVSSYLVGVVAHGEEGVAVPPAAFEGLEAGAGVVTEHVLLQVLLHAEDQRAAVPLWGRGRCSHTC